MNILIIILELIFKALIKLRLIFPIAYIFIILFFFPEFDREYPIITLAGLAIIMIFVIISWVITIKNYVSERKYRVENETESANIIINNNTYNVNGNIIEKSIINSGDNNQNQDIAIE